MTEPTTITVYVPEVVTSVERANALPGRSLVLTDVFPQTWTRLAAPDSLDDFTEQDMPLNVLVPVTAAVEEQWVETYPGGGGRRLGAPPLPHDYPRDHELSRETRYTTPWTPEEEA